ncbi:TSUP family transporter [Nodosilinea nodulosa]|uniref:TSUP family transporter n=1 Tax=Nodosilinea nodulosa TaxID=416001 RepID=UPI0002E20034|nr:TSUP family transporter [Nodosilinea nodulosa]
MELSLALAALLFGVAAIAGCLDTIAGGGGLIALPALLMAGVPPAAAIATNKLQGSGGTFTATLYFLRQGAMRLSDNRLAIATTFLGAIAGGWLVLKMDATTLAKIIPFLLIALGSYFALSPKLGAVDSQRRVSHGVFSALVAPLLGFYDGFFGPGTGMFMALAFVSLGGYNLAKATAHTKLLNFTSNIAALLYFLLFGQIYWAVGLIMLCGQFLGAYVGARLVVTRGAGLIRPVVTVVCFVMAAKLWMDAYG